MGAYICRVKLHYGHSLSRIDFHNRTAVFVDSSGSELAKKYTFLVGSDGARSRVRGLLEEYDSSMTHEEHLSDRSYKGFHRLPAVGNSAISIVLLLSFILQTDCN